MSEMNNATFPIEESNYKCCMCMYCPMMYASYRMMPEYYSVGYSDYYRSDWTMVNDYIMFSKTYNAYYNIKNRYLAFFDKKQNK